MKIYLYVDLDHLGLLNKLAKHNNIYWDELDKVFLHTEKTYENQIMVSLDHDTYIILLDHNKIEIV